MSSAPIIPSEIDKIIIDLLAEDDENYVAIKACSLVCRSFLHLCRKHIFASIVLNFRRSPTTRQLERLLSKSPEIADYIRKLDYRIKLDGQECLKRISRLESFIVGYHSNRAFDWDNNPIRPLLLHLLHLPTLTHFEIKSIKNFAVSDLAPCVNLKKLHIGYSITPGATNTFAETLPDRSIQLNEFGGALRSDTAILSICTAQRPDGQPVIDFSSLTKITIEFDEYCIMEVLQELFRRCKQLVNVSISFGDAGYSYPSLSKLLRPSMQTLTHLDISTCVYDCEVAPLSYIPSELEDMRNINVIEKIAIAVGVETHDGCKHGDDWGRLDEVLTSSGWDALRQVLLTIKFNSGLSIETEDALRNFLETQFPRLSMKKSVSFKWEITRDWR